MDIKFHEIPKIQKIINTLGFVAVRVVVEYPYNESNRKAMNRNWSNQKANPAPKTKAGNKLILQIDKMQYNKLLTERAAISQKVATQQPKLN